MELSDEIDIFMSFYETLHFSSASFSAMLQHYFESLPAEGSTTSLLMIMMMRLLVLLLLHLRKVNQFTV